MSAQSSTERDVALLKAFGEAFNAHDADALVSMMTEDCVFRTAMGNEAHGSLISGKEAVKAAFVATFKNFPDARWVPRAKDEVVGNRGFSEWTFIATRASDGAKFHMDGVDLFILRDGKIAVKDAYRKDRPPITA